MKRATVRDLRYRFSDVEASLAEGEDIEIVRRGRPIARLIPVATKGGRMPDFLTRMRAIHGDVELSPSSAELLARDRERF